MKSVKLFLKQFKWLVASKRKVQFALYDANVYVRAIWAHAKVARTIKALKAKKEPIRVGFIIISDTEFQLEGVYRLMLEDSRFDPYIIVTAQLGWTGNNYKEKIAGMMENLSAKFGVRVLSSLSGDKFIEIAHDCDLFVTTSPYDNLLHDFYKTETLAMAGKPVIMSDYTYFLGSEMEYSFASTRRGQDFIWRYYAENEDWKRLLEKQHLILRKYHKVVMSGYPKLDLMSDVKHLPGDRKTILLCPHHTIRADSILELGNFLRYANLFLSLPKKYKDIDWIFRPHPLLPSALVANGHWKEGQWDEYITEFVSTPNAKYVPSGSYYDMFVNSDAMIQDCSSFLSEYHCSGHPQCYLIRSKAHIQSQLREWGMELLSHAYTAENEKEIIRFIDEVVLAGNDPKAKAREQFAKEKILVNYPHVNEWIFNDIKEALGK